MPLGFQNTLNRFQFERTVDWRVGLPYLLAIDASLNAYFPEGYLFAKTLTMPTSFIEVEDDPQLVGFYQSKLIQPTLSMELFTDGNGKLETALRIWNRASFTNEGYMPSPYSNVTSNNYPMQAVQHIIIDRINPVNIEEVKKSFSGQGDSRSYKILEQYIFHGYLSKLPDYSGSNSASVRTVNLTIKVLSMQISLAKEAWEIEKALSRKNPTEGFYSDITDAAKSSERTLNLYMNR